MELLLSFGVKKDIIENNELFLRTEFFRRLIMYISPNDIKDKQIRDLSTDECVQILLRCNGDSGYWTRDHILRSVIGGIESELRSCLSMRNTKQFAPFYLGIAIVSQLANTFEVKGAPKGSCSEIKYAFKHFYNGDNLSSDELSILRDFRNGMFHRGVPYAEYGRRDDAKRFVRFFTRENNKDSPIKVGEKWCGTENLFDNTKHVSYIDKNWFIETILSMRDIVLKKYSNNEMIINVSRQALLVELLDASPIEQSP